MKDSGAPHFAAFNGLRTPLRNHVEKCSLVSNW